MEIPTSKNSVRSISPHNFKSRVIFSFSQLSCRMRVPGEPESEPWVGVSCGTHKRMPAVRTSTADRDGYLCRGASFTLADGKAASDTNSDALWSSSGGRYDGFSHRVR
jgi:hypothetical protein